MRTSLLKLGVYLPQLLCLALGLLLEMVLQQVGVLSTWALPLVVGSGLTNGLAFITTITKASTIQREGWGHFDARLATTCRACASLRASLHGATFRLAEAELAILQLDPP